MYKKVIECLKDMAYAFNEYEKVIFAKNDFSIHNAIKVKKDNSQCVYLEFKEDGSIWVWDMDGKYQYEIRPNKTYIMTFELCWVLNN